MFFFFFFQAEDGIRDYKVTGVQTCALPILSPGRARARPRGPDRTARPALPSREARARPRRAEPPGEGKPQAGARSCGPFCGDDLEVRLLSTYGSDAVAHQPRPSSAHRSAESLLACRFGLAPDNVARRVTSLPAASHLVPLEVSGSARGHHLTCSQNAGIRPRLPDNAVSADGNNPNRERVAVGPFQRPAFAVGGCRQRPCHEHAVLRAYHRLAFPGACNIGEPDSAALRQPGSLSGR